MMACGRIVREICQSAQPTALSDALRATLSAPAPTWQLAYLNEGSRTLPPWMHHYEMRQIRKSEHWICRYSDEGMSLDPREHLKVFVAALHVAMLQMGGGVGSIVPENTSGESLIPDRSPYRSNGCHVLTRSPHAFGRICRLLLVHAAWLCPVGHCSGYHLRSDCHRRPARHQLSANHGFAQLCGRASSNRRTLTLQFSASRKHASAFGLFQSLSHPLYG